jgi:hypothetical protein
VDDVFAAFSTAPLRDLPAPDENAVARETPYLWNKVNSVVAGIPIRKNYIDFSLSTAKPEDPYCLIVNACLAGNAGEKLMAAAARELLARVRPDLHCVIADPNVDRSLIARAALVVLGPGGMLYDLVDHAELAIAFQNVANYFRFGYMAREYRRPFCIIGLAQQSKIASRTTLDFVRRAVSDATFVTTRDSETAKLFVEGLRFRHPIVATPDVSVLFSKEIRRISCQPSERRNIAICGSFGIEIILAALRGFVGETRFVVQAGEDASWLAQHEQRLRAEISRFEVVDVRFSGVDLFLRAVASVDAIITTRFHTMMIGIIAGIDTVILGIANDKRHRVCFPLEKEPWIQFLDSDTIDPQSLQSIIERTVRSGKRLPSRGIFRDTDLDEVCHLLQSTAWLAPAVIKTQKSDSRVALHKEN